MSLSIRRNSRRRTKKPIEQKQLVGEGFFIGLDFVTRISDIVDSVESFSVNPNILFKGDSVLVDYGDALKGRKRIKDEIQTFFEATAVKGDTLTLTDGEFLDARTGDEVIYNVSGTYTFESFNPNTFIALLTKVSVKNESSTYSRYDKNFFINGSLKWTTSSSTKENKTEQINEIVNRIGKHSVNSFSSVFKTVKPNDTLDIKVGSDISSYTVSSYYVDSENMEHIELVEDVPTDTTLFGSEVFVILRRKETEEKSRTTSLSGGGGGMGNGYNPSASIPPIQDAGIEVEVEVTQPGTVQSKEISDLIKSAQNTLDSIKNKRTTTPKKSTVDSSVSSSLQTAKEKWQQSGKNTFNVSIENDSKGVLSYVINGKTKPTLELDAGKTYRFNVSHISNGIKGFTNMSHEFIIMGENGAHLKAGNIVRSSSKPGTRGADVYITIPTNRTTLKYLCRERTIEGGNITVINARKQSRQSLSEPTCPQGQHWMPAVNGKSGYCMKDSDMNTTTRTTSRTSYTSPSTRTSTPSNGGMSSSGY